MALERSNLEDYVAFAVQRFRDRLWKLGWPEPWCRVCCDSKRRVTGYHLDAKMRVVIDDEPCLVCPLPPDPTAVLGSTP